MKTINYVVCVSILMFLVVFNNLSAQTITVRFQNVDVKRGGYLSISLYNSENGYPYYNKAFKTMYVLANKPETIVTFDNLKPGTYAINVFHDENSNKKMETNFIGIPTEGYGFSNNPRLFGPPTFNKTKFEFNGTVLKLDIKMNY